MTVTEQHQVLSPEQLPEFLEKHSADLIHPDWVMLHDFDQLTAEAQRNRRYREILDHSVLRGYGHVRGVARGAGVKYVFTEGYEDYRAEMLGNTETPEDLISHFFAQGIALGIKLKREQAAAGTPSAFPQG